MRTIDIRDIPEEAFQKYHKKGITYARVLTEVDYDLLNGVILTKEGLATFHPGDFLAVGVEGEEWPISLATMQRTKKRIGEPDEEGWDAYLTTTITLATKIDDDEFTVNRANGDPLTGKKGDYLCKSGSRVWVVDADIFHATYKEVPENADVLS